MLQKFPPMLIRAGMIKGDLAQSFVAEGGSLFHARPTQNVAGSFSVRDHISCTKPGLRRKGHALRQGSFEGNCIGTELFYFGAVNPAGISAGESNSAPQISVIFGRKRGDRAVNLHDIRPFDEPKAATQALMEDVPPLWRERGNLWLQRSLPVEVAFMETVTVNHQGA
jgi:hypothetical protein